MDDNEEFSTRIEELLQEDDRITAIENMEYKNEEQNDINIVNDTIDNDTVNNTPHVIENELQTDITSVLYTQTNEQNNTCLPTQIKKKVSWKDEDEEIDDQYNQSMYRQHNTCSAWVACLQRHHVRRMVTFAIVFILFTLPIFMTVYKRYLPFCFTNGNAYNSFGALVFAILASIMFTFATFQQ